ncbi:IST1-like protein [Camellia lanceoleosa]|uniref:IST1-like protein n=1 Tax=Camellia lanceoleosa TaxID=1840588 RepID=A0ACC0HTK3_9ERIC|nr:IST1-like protein [Camellia lanceoleosa]
MSMLDFFNNKGFKASKCKTLLKLTIPRIKLLRNKREIHVKQMRRDIAKLLETGQEATARIRVEHIIREEKMMAAQEIIELFCELITVRLPIIETQRECPLDLKEAISSVCFAAPRCADLPELLQAQMLFTAKYGKEFVSAATELMPECGVNRQLVELLSVRAPDPDVKLKLLKEIAEEHELDWDPVASETELLKPHEDLLNGPTQFVSGSKLPLPEEKHEEPLYSASEKAPDEQSDSDAGSETSDIPEVPKASVRPSVDTASAPEMLPSPEVNLQSAKNSDVNESLLHELNLEHDTASAPEMLPSPEANLQSAKNSDVNESLLHELNLEHDEVLQEKSVPNTTESAKIPVCSMEDKQFLPFISPPSQSSATFPATFPVRQSEPPMPLSRTKSEANVDLQDVLAAAQTAAESAERAATAARSAASLAQLRISELVKKKNDQISDNSSENPFHMDTCQSPTMDKPHLFHQNSSGNTGCISNSPSPHQDHANRVVQQVSSLPSYDNPKVEFDSSLLNSDVPGHDIDRHQPQRLPSMDDEPYFSYPNLFTQQDSNVGSAVHSIKDNS